jgi:hypothetical protein
MSRSSSNMGNAGSKSRPRGHLVRFKLWAWCPLSNYAPLRRRGGILFSTCRSVGPSIRWFPDDNLRTLRPRIMKLHWYIDHDWQMTHLDFQVTRSRSQLFQIIKWFQDGNSRMLRPRIMKLRIMKLHRNIDHDWQMTPIDFQVTRSKVTVTKTYSHNGCHYNWQPIWGACMFYKQPLYILLPHARI